MTLQLRHLLFILLLGIGFCLPVTYAIESECAGEDCEETAPYVLKIIKSGEGEPRSSNSTEQGMQDNRRVDVTLTRKVPVEEIKSEVRSAELQDGGRVWISQDHTSLDKILNVSVSGSVFLLDGKPDSSVTFEIESNYATFIDQLELLIWNENSSSYSQPIYKHVFDPSLGIQSFEWQLQDSELDMSSDRDLSYSLRASDSKGHVDETERQLLRVENRNTTSSEFSDLPAISINDEIDEVDIQYSELLRNSIPVWGSKVRIAGQDIDPNNTLTINKNSISVDDNGKFGWEELLPDGSHEFSLVVYDADEEVLNEKLNVEVDSNYFFMVGLADLTVGENKVSGSLEPLAVDEHHYGGDIFVDGRLAFYLKGKVKGKYLITAQMDTGTEDVEHLFDDFHRKDPQSVFRRLDPEQYYPVYGDDSQLIDDTDSQGKLYVRVDWNRSRALWGNFNTNFTGTEFTPFNRSLYGAQLLLNSTKDTNLGDATHSLNAFASKAQSLFRHNEFRGTGGSLYYLRDTDIVAGSEKVWVEVRQSDSGRVVQKVALVAGRDYDIDDFQGRIILRRPLLSVTAQTGPSIIRDEPVAGNQTFLVVDYEYSPANLDFNDTSAGVRAKKWVGDNLGIGGTWAHENREGQDYDIKGVDVTLKRSEQTYIKGEFAQSSSLQTSGSFLSDDGGLSFNAVQTTGNAIKGNAIGIEARMSLLDFKPQSRQLDVGLWTKNIEAGFSTASSNVSTDTTDMGIEFVSRPADQWVVSARAARVQRKNDSTEVSASGQLDYLASDKLTVSTELQNIDKKNVLSNTRGQSSVIAGKAAYDVSDNLNVYGVYQHTLRHSGSEDRNNATSLGAKYEVNNRLRLTGEISSGDAGNSTVLGTEVSFSDTYSIYSNYTYSLNRDSVEKNSIVVGQRKSLSSQLNVYSEHLFSDEDTRNTYAHTLGLDHKISRYSSIGVSIQQAAIDNEDNTRTDRETVSTGFTYRRDNTRFNSKLEYRRDQGIGIDIRQWVTTTRFEYRKTPSFRWQGKFNASVSNDRIGDDDARFIESGIGFAYRPVYHDRLNMLGRLTYISDLQPLSQSSDVDQRALISSAEGLYDITRFWSVGAKLAYRNSEIRLQRNTGSWVENDASLVSGRLRYKAHFGVDATFAYHWLSSKSTQGNRHGALFTIGRRVGDNLTFSVGYNFTSFDDDLSNDSYDAKGWFINLVGAY